MATRSSDAARRAGERFGRLFFRVARKRRERALANLRLAMPELDEAERARIALGSFEHFGRMTVDFLRSGRRTNEELIASIDVRGRERLEAAYARGRGVILISGHLGNWERMAAWIVANGFPAHVVARDVDDAGLNASVNRLRERSGLQVISRGDAARPILSALRRGECVGILPDQNSDEIFIPFFGHPAGTVLGPGVIAERSGAPVICCWCFDLGDHYLLEFEEELVPDPIQSVKGDGIMRAIHARLEAAIRRHPDQWLWFHDRWRAARRRGLVP